MADQAKERVVTLTGLTEGQARGNRLLATKTSPGWPDIVQIVRELEQTAIDNSVNFQGWDTEQIVILKARAQAAREYREELFNRIETAIMQATMAANTNTAQDAARADELRADVLRFDTRIPGTYETGA